MELSIREASSADADAIAPLLVKDGAEREALDRCVWKVDVDAQAKVASAFRSSMDAATPPFRQQWLLAEAGDRIVGLAHTILLPVPPFYAGDFGPPGLIMEDCVVSRGAPAGTSQALLEAAEADLIEAGAQILLGSSVVGGTWEKDFVSNDYVPLTLYYAKTGLRMSKPPDCVKPAKTEDVPDIVRLSAENREVLHRLNEFWKPHNDADARFGAWMQKCLTLPDRDMFVSREDAQFTGYAISQPATRLHFPPSHEIGAIGIIDDFFHANFSDPTQLKGTGSGASKLLEMAETALAARGYDAAMVVCPAVWTTKRNVLKRAGYRTAITWFKKRSLND